MPNYGLLLLGIIQLVTGTAMFLSVRRPTLAGMETLPASLSIYRYMLTALWISLAVVFFAGAFFSSVATGAVLLAATNVALEILGYWAAVWKRLMPLWYAALSTFGMGLGGVLAVVLCPP